MAKVSIIVPVYNVSALLPRCLESLVHQTLKDIEIICVNDGSTDNSLDILNEYAKNDSRIIVISQENGNIGKARNTGMLAATGEFIGYVDSDDYIDLEFYEKLYDAAIRNGADIASASILRQRKYTSKYRIKYEKEEVFEDIQSKLQAAKIPALNYVWNKIYKRDKLNNSGVKFVEGRYFEDIPYSIRVMYHLGKLVTVSGPKYYYWVNTVSTVKTGSDKKTKDIKDSKEDMKSFAIEHNIRLDKRAMLVSKSEIKLFGVKILKIYYWENNVEYHLFGFIPFIKRRNYF